MSAMVIIEVKAICHTARDRQAMMAFLFQNPKLNIDSNMFQCNRDIDMFTKHLEKGSG